MSLLELDQGALEIIVKSLSVDRNWSVIIFAISNRPNSVALIRNEIS